MRSQSGTKTNNPQLAKVTLFLLAIAVGILTCLNERLLSFLYRRGAHAFVALRPGLELFNTAMTGGTTGDTHDERG